MIEVGDGQGAEQARIDDILARLPGLMKKATNLEEIRGYIKTLVALGYGRLSEKQEITITFAGMSAGVESVTFPAAVLGEPPGDWYDASDSPQFLGYYWVKSGKEVFPADFDSKGWRAIDGGRITVQSWKHRWTEAMIRQSLG